MTTRLPLVISGFSTLDVSSEASELSEETSELSADDSAEASFEVLSAETAVVKQTRTNKHASINAVIFTLFI
jgi:hypothetical protein